MNSASAQLPADVLESHGVRAYPAAAGGTRSADWPVAILGVPFDHVTIEQSIARIETMVASRKPHYVVTANVDFLVQAHRDVELRRILLNSDLVLCDGTPLVWASRWLGNALPERVAGADLVPRLIETAAAKNLKLFLLGAAPGVAEQATARLKQQYPALRVDCYAPPFAALLEMDHGQIVRRVREARPDILLVSFGCPKQEKWIAMHHRALGVPVAIGVGATIDFLAGRVPRAPHWMRHSGTEWLFRLIQEPRRLIGRYTQDLLSFVPALGLQCLRLVVRRRGESTHPALSFAAPEWCGIDPGDRLTRSVLERDARFWSEVPSASAHCIVNAAKVRAIDSTGIAFLVRWHKFLQARGRQLVLLAPSSRVRRALAALKLDDHFLIARNVDEAARQAEALAAQPAVMHDAAARSLAWCGEIIAANVEDVWRMTSEYVRTFASTGATLVIIDLDRLRFIDSAGAGLMLRLKKWAQDLPAEILFTHPQPNVRNVLHLTRLDQLLLEGAQ